MSAKYRTEQKAVSSGNMRIDRTGHQTNVVACGNIPADALAAWYDCFDEQSPLKSAIIGDGKRFSSVSDIVDEVVRLVMVKLEDSGILAIAGIARPVVAEPRDTYRGPKRRCSLWQLTGGASEGYWVAVSPDGQQEVSDELVGAFPPTRNYDELKTLMEGYGFRGRAAPSSGCCNLEVLMTARIKAARLGERTQLLLRTLSDLTDERHHPPTLAELGSVMGTGKSHIHEMMGRLEAFGLVEKRSGQWWPSTYVILRLSDTKVRFLNRIRGSDSIEDMIAKLIEREMTSGARASTVHTIQYSAAVANAKLDAIEVANPQEEMARARKAKEDREEGDFWDSI